jgi:phospholipase C
MRRSPLIATAGALVIAVSATLPAIASAAAPASAATLRPAGLGSTTTPIKHVVVIIGENHTAQYDLRLPGCDGQAENTPDKRFPANLPNGPFQITKYVPYDDSHLEYTGGCEFYGAFVGDPLHRFYQMWQQTAYDNKLFTWTANTAGDDNGAGPPAPIYQGAVQMGYYNMAEGDAPILKDLAEKYAISDNYHQAVQGGTGANHIALGTGFAASYQNAAGVATPPPTGEIENPDPKPGTNNNYTQDGYGSSTTPNTGGSYSECADRSQPGVGAVFDYLDTLPYQALNNCQPGRYYLLNNYNPGYTVTGAVQTAPYTVPPQESDYVTIGQALSAKNISWGYFGEGYNNGKPTSGYCGICDPMQYSSAIMTNPARRTNTQLDSSNFISQAEAGTLPAVSFLKPADDDGHPGYSSLYAFENFVARAVAAVQSNTAEWKSTAIFVTMDEGGGYYDSGYIQPVSFFGDGPRVPLILVSPYARHGAVDHTYKRSRVDPQVHRGELGSLAADQLQRGQPAQPDARGLRAAGPAGHRRPDDHVQLPPSGLREGAASLTG